MKVEDVFKFAEKARAEWAEKHIDEKHIRNTVHSRLDKILDVAIYTFMGMEYSFGSWTVDRANSRKTQLTREIESLVSAEVSELVVKHAAQVTVDPDPEIIKALREEYKHVLHYRLREWAQKKAQQDAELLISQVLELELNFEQMFKDCAQGVNELAEEAER